MQDHGLEVRHEENLREHYALTLRDWCSQPRGHWDEAVAEVGERKARVWKLYMAASRAGFELNRLELHQVLGRAAGRERALRGCPCGRTGRAATRSALILVSLIAALAGCGGGDDGSGDLANGKVFDAAAVKSCLRKEGVRIEPHETDTGIDFTVRWGSGLENTDVAVEGTRAPRSRASGMEEARRRCRDRNIDS